MFKKLEEEIDEVLFLGFDIEKKLLHIFRAIKELQQMSTTEAEAIAGVKTAVSAIAPALSDLTTAVGLVVVAAGDNPVKVADLDAVKTGLLDVTTKLTTLTVQINAALVVPPPVTPPVVP